MLKLLKLNSFKLAIASVVLCVVGIAQAGTVPLAMFQPFSVYADAPQSASLTTVSISPMKLWQRQAHQIAPVSTARLQQSSLVSFHFVPSRNVGLGCSLKVRVVRVQPKKNNLEDLVRFTPVALACGEDQYDLTDTYDLVGPNNTVLFSAKKLGVQFEQGKVKIARKITLTLAPKSCRLYLKPGQYILANNVSYQYGNRSYKLFLGDTNRVTAFVKKQLGHDTQVKMIYQTNHNLLGVVAQHDGQTHIVYVKDDKSLTLLSKDNDSVNDYQDLDQSLVVQSCMKPRS